ncbi:SCO family protein [Skermanella aerolata]|uniref:SCO family protein n=2 Tax=Skermanella aerolata TaxID=393310 RepID=A0A512E2Q7_9PROT|nr:SCO family protein [Skermanella aerolata]KJB90797.1 hypothetical protein N826_34530 [Skermanella aerolata KACC 11604]GEO42966.1 SCO family protein [Skermanella aerolata]
MLNLRNIRFVLWMLVGLAVGSLAILVWQIAATEPQRAGTIEPGRPMAEGANWSLLDEAGRPFTPADLRGRPTLLVFGFTHCPDVCPTSLSYVANALQALGPQAEDVRSVFLTVDPERDTAQVMSEYTALFDERILGVTGKPEEVTTALKSLGAFARKAPLDGGGYNVDHTASMLLLDAQGRLRSTLDVHEPAEVAAEKVRRLLSTS